MSAVGLAPGPEGVDGQHDEQGGEHEAESGDAAEQGRSDQATGECAERPGGMQAELGPQDAGTA